MKKFLSILAAAAFLPAAASALCPEPNMGNNDTILSLLPNNNGNTMSGPKSNVGESHRRWKGTLYYSESDNMLLICDGANWVDVVSGQYGQDGTDGAGTSGEGAPSDTRIYGPYTFTSGVQTFGTIHDGQPSSATIHYQIVGEDTNDACRIETKIHGNWKTLATAMATEYDVENNSGNFTTHTRDGVTRGSFDAYKYPNGTYKMFVTGGSFLNNWNGNWKGQFRIAGDDDCEAAVAAEVRNE